MLAEIFTGDLPPTRAVEKARSALNMTAEFTFLLLMLPVAFAHKASPNLFFSFFSAWLLFAAGGGGGGDGHHHAIHAYMPPHLIARYNAAAILLWPVLGAALHFTGASLGAGAALLFLGAMPITGALLWHNCREYCWEAKWAREHPALAAERAAEKAAEDAKWWKEAEKTAQDYIHAACVVGFWAIAIIVTIAGLIKTGAGKGAWIGVLYLYMCGGAFLLSNIRK